jgi:hypothetical protein
MHGPCRPRPAQLPPPPDPGARTGDLQVRTADPRVRIGDAERDRVIDQLADHHAAGRLTLAEFEDRMAAAQTARTGADLAVRTYLAVMALLWLIWLASAVVNGASYPWPIWPMLGWGIGVAGKHRRDPARPAP